MAVEVKVQLDGRAGVAAQGRDRWRWWRRRLDDGHGVHARRDQAVLQCLDLKTRRDVAGHEPLLDGNRVWNLPLPGSLPNRGAVRQEIRRELLALPWEGGFAAPGCARPALSPAARRIHRLKR